MNACPQVLLALAFLAGPTLAQQPDEARGPKAVTPSRSAQVAPRRSFAELPAPHNSILRQRPWHEDFVPDAQRPYSYRSHAPANQEAGFRNPGGVGRRAEYYPPGDQFQVQVPTTAPHVTARIGLGGVPDRNEQLRSQSVGTAYYGMLQNHIDMYGSPRFGFGFGFGW